MQLAQAKTSVYKIKVPDLIFSYKCSLVKQKEVTVLRDHDDEGEDYCQKIKFNLERNDYFGTLSTTLDLLQQERKKQEKDHARIIKSIQKNLLCLQKNYRIIKKKSKQIST